MCRSIAGNRNVSKVTFRKTYHFLSCRFLEVLYIRSLETYRPETTMSTFVSILSIYLCLPAVTPQQNGGDLRNPWTTNTQQNIEFGSPPFILTSKSFLKRFDCRSLARSRRPAGPPRRLLPPMPPVYDARLGQAPCFANHQPQGLLRPHNLPPAGLYRTSAPCRMALI